MLAAQMPRSECAPRAVHGHIAGTVEIKTKQMKRLLGRNAWTVWLYMLGCRDAIGRTRVFNIRIAANRDLSRKQVRHACMRLKRAGLLEYIGTAMLDSNSFRKSKTRIVHGDYRNGSITIPEKKWSALMAMTPHGGKRKGAGRKKSKAARSVDQTPQVHLRSVASDDLSGHLSLGTGQIDSSCTNLPNQGVPTSTKKNAESGCGATRLGAAEQALGKDLGKINSFLRRKECADAVSAPIASLSDAERLARIEQICAPGGPIIPRYPCTSTMCCVRTPSPPLLSDTIDGVDAVMTLVRAYRGAVELHYKVQSFVFANGDIKRSPYYESLLEAVDTLRDFEIAPAAWASFSCDVWRHYNRRGKKNPPPISFVFASKRIIERHEWFLAEGGTYSSGGKVMISKEQKDLLSRYGAVTQGRSMLIGRIMKQHAHTVGVPVEVVEEIERGLRALMEKWFPGGFEWWLERAQLRGEDDARRLKQMIERGDFLWG